MKQKITCSSMSVGGSGIVVLAFMLLALCGCGEDSIPFAAGDRISPGINQEGTVFDVVEIRGSWMLLSEVKTKSRVWWFTGPGGAEVWSIAGSK